jgi:Uma2 family endonuclease
MPTMVTFAIMTENEAVVQGPPQGHWTREDWEQLPKDDNRKYEIIEGHIYVSTSPSLFHNWIIRRLDEYVGLPAERAGLGFAATMQAGVFMPSTQPAQPDFVFVSASRADIIHDRHINGVPDLIIEVLSPGNSTYDLETKYLAYEKARVPEYAIVDARTRELRLYRLGVESTYSPASIYKQDDLVTFACLPGLQLRVGALFDGAPDTTL